MAYDTTKKQSPPEFLLKLYKILTQEDEDIIEWEKGNFVVQQGVFCAYSAGCG